MYKTYKDVISNYAQTGNLEIPCVSDVCGVAWSKLVASLVLPHLKTDLAAHSQLKEMYVSEGLFIPSVLDMYLELEWGDLWRSIA